jgi:23S rRNA (cytosine1962-C5)-methyltransferase
LDLQGAGVLDGGTMANDRRRPAPFSEGDTEDRLPTAYLKPGEADRVVAGHPWVYEASIVRLTREPEDGEVIQVKDHRRRFLGVGFYNARSKIRIRVLSSERTELDEAFLERRVRAAVDHRRRFLPGASSCRLVNAEGDLLSGLIVDKYEDVLVVQMSSAGMDRRKEMIGRILQKLVAPRAILERNDMGARRFEGLPETSGLLSGELSETEQRALPARLNGIQFEVDLRAGHKTGLYLDQQVNHVLVASMANGARVLDGFCFIGGFALHAARAGAAAVVGVEQSEEAVATARRLAEFNGVGNACTFTCANVFDWLRAQTAAVSVGAAEPRFDLIILDPPSFTRNRAAVPDALRGYKEIHLRALRLLEPGGILATFCCSHHVDARTFEGVVREAAFDARKQLRRVALYTQAPDHPVLPAVPETEYLKGFAFEMLGA